MRLQPKEIKVFVEVLSAELSPGDGKLFLYGSRADDSLKGGDIDLVLILMDPEKAKTLAKNRASLLSQFKKRLGDQKIDFSILSETELSSDVFYRKAMKTAILLKGW